MFELDPSQFDPPVRTLLEAEPLNVLAPDSPNAKFRGTLSSLHADTVLAPAAAIDQDMAQCCVSALWLLYDFLNESHVISQDINTATGSYWHGLMHRREPDYSNAKYWFRRVGDHELFDSLCSGARELAESEVHDREADFLESQSDWDPYRFVDLCEAVTNEQSPCEKLCRRVAQLEWRLLFDFSVRQATGK